MARRSWSVVIEHDVLVLDHDCLRVVPTRRGSSSKGLVVKAFAVVAIVAGRVSASARADGFGIRRWERSIGA